MRQCPLQPIHSANSRGVASLASVSSLLSSTARRRGVDNSPFASISSHHQSRRNHCNSSSRLASESLNRTVRFSVLFKFLIVLATVSALIPLCPRTYLHVNKTFCGFENCSLFAAAQDMLLCQSKTEIPIVSVEYAVTVHTLKGCQLIGLNTYMGFEVKKPDEIGDGTTGAIVLKVGKDDGSLGTREVTLTDTIVIDVQLVVDTTYTHLSAYTPFHLSMVNVVMRVTNRPLWTHCLLFKGKNPLPFQSVITIVNTTFDMGTISVYRFALVDIALPYLGDASSFEMINNTFIATIAPSTSQQTGGDNVVGSEAYFSILGFHASRIENTIPTVLTGTRSASFYSPSASFGTRLLGERIIAANNYVSIVNKGTARGLLPSDALSQASPATRGLIAPVHIAFVMSLYSIEMARRTVLSSVNNHFDIVASKERMTAILDAYAREEDALLALVKQKRSSANQQNREGGYLLPDTIYTEDWGSKTETTSNEITRSRRGARVTRDSFSIFYFGSTPFFGLDAAANSGTLTKDTSLHNRTNVIISGAATISDESSLINTTFIPKVSVISFSKISNFRMKDQSTLSVRKTFIIFNLVSAVDYYRLQASTPSLLRSFRRGERVIGIGDSSVGSLAAIAFNGVRGRLNDGGTTSDAGQATQTTPMADHTAHRVAVEELKSLQKRREGNNDTLPHANSTASLLRRLANIEGSVSIVVHAAKLVVSRSTSQNVFPIAQWPTKSSTMTSDNNNNENTNKISSQRRLNLNHMGLIGTVACLLITEGSSLVAFPNTDTAHASSSSSSAIPRQFRVNVSNNIITTEHVTLYPPEHVFKAADGFVDGGGSSDSIPRSLYPPPLHVPADIFFGGNASASAYGSYSSSSDDLIDTLDDMAFFESHTAVTDRLFLRLSIVIVEGNTTVLCLGGGKATAAAASASVPWSSSQLVSSRNQIRGYFGSTALIPQSIDELSSSSSSSSSPRRDFAAVYYDSTEWSQFPSLMHLLLVQSIVSVSRGAAVLVMVAAADTQQNQQQQQTSLPSLLFNDLSSGVSSRDDTITSNGLGIADHCYSGVVLVLSDPRGGGSGSVGSPPSPSLLRLVRWPLSLSSSSPSASSSQAKGVVFLSVVGAAVHSFAFAFNVLTPQPLFNSNSPQQLLPRIVFGASKRVGRIDVTFGGLGVLHGGGDGEGGSGGGGEVTPACFAVEGMGSIVTIIDNVFGADSTSHPSLARRSALREEGVLKNRSLVACDGFAESDGIIDDDDSSSCTTLAMGISALDCLPFNCKNGGEGGASPSSSQCLFSPERGYVHPTVVRVSAVMAMVRPQNEEEKASDLSSFSLSSSSALVLEANTIQLVVGVPAALEGKLMTIPDVAVDGGGGGGGNVMPRSKTVVMEHLLADPFNVSALQVPAAITTSLGAHAVLIGVGGRRSVVATEGRSFSLGFASNGTQVWFISNLVTFSSRTNFVVGGSSSSPTTTTIALSFPLRGGTLSASLFLVASSESLLMFVASSSEPLQTSVVFTLVDDSCHALFERNVIVFNHDGGANESPSLTSGISSLFRFSAALFDIDTSGEEGICPRIYFDTGMATDSTSLFLSFTLNKRLISASHHFVDSTTTIKVGGGDDSNTNIVAINNKTAVESFPLLNFSTLLSSSSSLLSGDAVASSPIAADDDRMSECRNQLTVRGRLKAEDAMPSDNLVVENQPPVSIIFWPSSDRFYTEIFKLESTNSSTSSPSSSSDDHRLNVTAVKEQYLSSSAATRSATMAGLLLTRGLAFDYRTISSASASASASASSSFPLMSLTTPVFVSNRLASLFVFTSLNTLSIAAVIVEGGSSSGANAATTVVASRYQCIRDTAPRPIRRVLMAATVAREEMEAAGVDSGGVFIAPIVAEGPRDTRQRASNVKPKVDDVTAFKMLFLTATPPPPVSSSQAHVFASAAALRSFQYEHQPLTTTSSSSSTTLYCPRPSAWGKTMSYSFLTRTQSATLTEPSMTVSRPEGFTHTRTLPSRDCPIACDNITLDAVFSGDGGFRGGGVGVGVSEGGLGDASTFIGLGGLWPSRALSPLDMSSTVGGENNNSGVIRSPFSPCQSVARSEVDLASSSASASADIDSFSSSAPLPIPFSQWFRRGLTRDVEVRMLQLTAQRRARRENLTAAAATTATSTTLFSTFTYAVFDIRWERKNVKLRGLKLVSDGVANAHNASDGRDGSDGVVVTLAEWIPFGYSVSGDVGGWDDNGVSYGDDVDAEADKDSGADQDSGSNSDTAALLRRMAYQREILSTLPPLTDLTSEFAVYNYFYGVNDNRGGARVILKIYFTSPEARFISPARHRYLFADTINVRLAATFSCGAATPPVILHLSLLKEVRPMTTPLLLLPSSSQLVGSDGDGLSLSMAAASGSSLPAAGDGALDGSNLLSTMMVVTTLASAVFVSTGVGVGFGGSDVGAVAGGGGGGGWAMAISPATDLQLITSLGLASCSRGRARLTRLSASSGGGTLWRLRPPRTRAEAAMLFDVSPLYSDDFTASTIYNTDAGEKEEDDTMPPFSSFLRVISPLATAETCEAALVGVGYLVGGVLVLQLLALLVPIVASKLRRGGGARGEGGSLTLSSLMASTRFPSFVIVALVFSQSALVTCGVHLARFGEGDSGDLVGTGNENPPVSVPFDAVAEAGSSLGSGGAWGFSYAPLFSSSSSSSPSSTTLSSSSSDSVKVSLRFDPHRRRTGGASSGMDVFGYVVAASAFLVYPLLAFFVTLCVASRAYYPLVYRVHVAISATTTTLPMQSLFVSDSSSSSARRGGRRLKRNGSSGGSEEDGIEMKEGDEGDAMQAGEEDINDEDIDDAEKPFASSVFDSQRQMDLLAAAYTSRQRRVWSFLSYFILPQGTLDDTIGANSGGGGGLASTGTCMFQSIVSGIRFPHIYWTVLVASPLPTLLANALIALADDPHCQAFYSAAIIVCVGAGLLLMIARPFSIPAVNVLKGLVYLVDGVIIALYLSVSEDPRLLVGEMTTISSPPPASPAIASFLPQFTVAVGESFDAKLILGFVYLQLSLALLIVLFWAFSVLAALRRLVEHNASHTSSPSSSSSSSSSPLLTIPYRLLCWFPLFEPYPLSCAWEAVGLLAAPPPPAPVHAQKHRRRHKGGRADGEEKYCESGLDEGEGGGGKGLRSIDQGKGEGGDRFFRGDDDGDDAVKAQLAAAATASTSSALAVPLLSDKRRCDGDTILDGDGGDVPVAMGKGRSSLLAPFSSFGVKVFNAVDDSVFKESLAQEKRRKEAERRLRRRRKQHQRRSTNHSRRQQHQQQEEELLRDTGDADSFGSSDTLELSTTSSSSDSYLSLP